MKKTILIMLLCIGIIITAKAIDPPNITFSPDTIDSSGEVNVRINFDNYKNFEQATIWVKKPDNKTWITKNVYNYELDSLNSKTLNYDIDKYELSGYYKLEVIIIWYNGIDTAMKFENKGFYVKNTTPDTVPPVIKSVYTAEYSDSIYLYINAYDTLSGIKDGFDFNLKGISEIYDLKFEKENDTLFKCNLSELNPYVASGIYFASLSMSDNANNYSAYEDSVKIENKYSDGEPPKIVWETLNKDTVFKDGDITLKFRITDNFSGIKEIYCAAYTNNYNGYVGSPEIDFKYKGVLDTTISYTFQLPEFGPSGTWLAGPSGNDFANNYINNSTKDPSFIYYPKYLDTKPPVFDTIIFEPRTVNAGDTVRIIINAYDDISGIKQINYDDNHSGFVNNWEMTDDKTYQALIPVNKYARAGDIKYSLWNITDAAGNSKELDREGLGYTIINNGPVDTVPPQFDSLKISPVVAGKDDTIKFNFYIHDDLSGIDTSDLEAMFTYQKVLYPSTGDGLFFRPKKLNNHEFVYTLLPGTVLPGTYYFDRINMFDSTGNYMYNNNFFDRGYYFEIQGEQQVDTIAPELISVKGYPAQVKPGDKVEIEIKVLEKESSLYAIFANLVDSNGVNSIPLYYKDWQISELNDTFTCKATYTVSKFTYSGKWEIQYLNFYDSYYNVGYGNTYNVFEVIDGQPQPNRNPCWIIPNMSFIIDPEQTLNYTIPDYLVSDIDGDQLNFYAKMSNGSDLPSWIGFSGDKLSLKFTPEYENAGKYKLYIFASDPGGLKDTLKINVKVNKVSPPVKILSAQNAAVKIYPNPAKDFINVICQEKIIAISLYDLTGKIALNTTGNINIIDISKMNRGVYILKAETEKTTLFEKVVLR